MSAFFNRQLNYVINLGGSTGTAQQSTFAAGGSTLTLPSGLRSSCRITSDGTPVATTADIEIYGLIPSLMQQLATIGLEVQALPRNSIQVMASNSSGTGFFTVFQGYIIMALTDYNRAPDVPLVLHCVAAALQAVLPASPLSYHGPTSVAQMMQTLANRMGFGFENNNVNVTLRNPYYRGSNWAMMRKLERDAGIEANVIAETNTLSITNKFQPRQSPQTVMIAPPPTGQMIGYPAFWASGIVVRNVYDPAITFGGQFKVQSSVLSGFQPQPAVPSGSFTNATFKIVKLDHFLQAQVPKGQWMSTIFGQSPYAPATIPQPPPGA